MAFQVFLGRRADQNECIPCGLAQEVTTLVIHCIGQDLALK